MAAHPKHQVGPRIARFTEELRIDIEFDAKEDAKNAAREQGMPLTKFARKALKDAVQRHKESRAWSARER